MIDVVSAGHPTGRRRGRYVLPVFDGVRTRHSERLIVAVYVALRVLPSLGKKAGVFTDTNLYLNFRWFHTRRPWTVVWLFDLFDGHNHTRIIWVQVLIAVPPPLLEDWRRVPEHRFSQQRVCVSSCRLCRTVLFGFR